MIPNTTNDEAFSAPPPITPLCTMADEPAPWPPGKSLMYSARPWE